MIRFILQATRGWLPIPLFMSADEEKRVRDAFRLRDEHQIIRALDAWRLEGWNARSYGAPDMKLAGLKSWMFNLGWNQRKTLETTQPRPLPDAKPEEQELVGALRAEIARLEREVEAAQARVSVAQANQAQLSRRLGKIPAPGNRMWVEKGWYVNVANLLRRVGDGKTRRADAKNRHLSDKKAAGLYADHMMDRLKEMQS